MSHDDFVKLVLDANLDTFFTNTLVLKKLKKFAESVELAEREACAVVAFNEAYSDEEACHISEAIRARGEK